MNRTHTHQPPRPPRPPVVGQHIQEFTDPAEEPFRLRDYSGLTINQTVELLMNLYGHKLKEFKAVPNMPDSLAMLNAANCWRAELPELYDRHSVLTYIACIAWGQRMRLLDPGEAKTMIFMAQTQLTALKGVQAPAGVVPRITGTGEQMVRNDPARPPMTFCLGCGGPVSNAAAETFGEYCSTDCLSKKAAA